MFSLPSQQASSTFCSLQQWLWPDKPWSRIHIDYAGPMRNKMYLVIIDTCSKRIDVFPVLSANSETNIDKLRTLFATHGIPNSIVTDNATVFVSEEMRKIWKNNGIQHITSSPYHPATNDLAEQVVQTFKAGFKHMTSGSVETKITRFLFNYRMTLQDITGSTPAELLMKQNLISHLDLWMPDVSNRVFRAQEQEKTNHI